MSETCRPAMFFTDMSEPMKMDDKRRLTIPKSVYGGDDFDDLIAVRASFAKTNVVALTKAAPYFEAVESERKLLFTLPFVRPVNLDSQNRFPLSKNEITHLGLNEVIFYGLGRVALISGQANHESIVEGFRQNFSGDDTEGESELKLLDTALNVTGISEARPPQ